MNIRAARARRGDSSRGIRTDQDDEGFILVMVLLFLLAIALIIGSLMTASTTAEQATTVQNTAHSDVFAVDAGIEHGIERLRNPADSPWCGTTTSDQITVNGATVTVTCTVLSGSITKISNWALVSLDPSNFNGIQTQSGSKPVEVLGPVYVGGGMNLQTSLGLDAQCAAAGNPTASCTGPDHEGFILQHSSNCSTLTSASSNPPNKGSKLPPLGNWSCTTLVPSINPTQPTMPGLPLASVPVSSTCTVLFPGKYTKAGTLPTASSLPLPNLTSANDVYLVSGDYYFDNVGTIDLGGSSSTATQIIGGNHIASESQITPSTGCDHSTLPAAITDVPATQGYGVEIILGGDSNINTNKGGMELFTREEPGSILPQPSLITVPASPAPAGAVGQPAAWGGSWDPSTLSGGSSLTSASGIQPNVAIHGLLYTPDASVSLFATNSSLGEILGGVVAWDISLQQSSSATGLAIATTLSPTVERAKITATVQFGGKPIVATADVTVNLHGDLTIGSWTVLNS